MQTLSFTTKFTFSYLIGTLLLVLTSIIGVIEQNSIEENTQKSNTYWKALDNQISRLHRTATTLQQTASVLRTAPDQTTYLATLSKYEGLKKQMNKQMGRLQEMYSPTAFAESMNLLEDLNRYYQSYVTSLQHYEEYIQSKVPAFADKIMVNSLSPSFSLTLQTLEIIRTHEINQTFNSILIAKKNLDLNKVLLAFCLIGIFLSLIVYPSYLLLKVRSKIEKLTFKLHSLFRAENATSPNYKNELERLEKEIDILQNEIQNLDFSLQQLAEKNCLPQQASTSSSSSWIHFRLRTLEQKILVLSEEDQIKKWQISTSNHFHELISSQALSSDLAEILLKEIINYFEFIIGAIYVAALTEREEIVLRLHYSYALHSEVPEKRTIKPGEGLLGQAIIEKKIIYITQIPVEFFSIQSGLGEAPPQALLIVPIIFGDQIVGALELASFQNLSPAIFTFFENFSHQFGVYFYHYLFLKNNTSLAIAAGEKQYLSSLSSSTPIAEKKNDHSNELEKKCQQLQEQNRLLETQLQEKEAQAIICKKELEHCQEEKKMEQQKHLQEYNKLKHKNAEIILQLASLEQELENTKEEKKASTQLKNEIEHLYSENQKLSQALIQTEQQLNQLQDEKEKVKLQIAALENIFQKYEELQLSYFQYDALASEIELPPLKKNNLIDSNSLIERVKELIETYFSNELTNNDPVLLYFWKKGDKNIQYFLLFLMPNSSSPFLWQGLLILLPPTVGSIELLTYSFLNYLQELVRTKNKNSDSANILLVPSNICQQLKLNIEQAEDNLAKISFFISPPASEPKEAAQLQQIILEANLPSYSITLAPEILKPYVSAITLENNIYQNLLKEAVGFLEMNKVGFIEDCNKNVLNMLELPQKEEIMGKHLTSIMPPQHEVIFDTIIEKINKQEYLFQKLTLVKASCQIVEVEAYFILKNLSSNYNSSSQDFKLLVFLLNKAPLTIN
ncbi:MAG: GAF domain-containing protein [Bacteroidia bacterium]|nr:GAF domain-containing protein [Bacteroidia bacterium]MDW8159430.1 GAF domain-containing protein [Bacteroidia bacterium]